MWLTLNFLIFSRQKRLPETVSHLSNVDFFYFLLVLRVMFKRAIK